ncbi:TerB family tellurite resistance protein [Hwanghaeella grinnelliae]|uniref:TerB family tellurite resistance protein n=1 Tax=Hwanghaeella grinnelliae TaxID=2500179 RepID=A0A437QNV4_9PROT|nr:TerB family tellurite resistance protein [Hwanghaeella grinnelliae]RVU36119.1 TerB family tellurite resistance protein [Hwanghaeella grinnelliae]
MIELLKNFLFDRENASVAEAAKEQDKLHIAAAALLLEAAQLDGSLEKVEKDRVCHIVQKRFNLDAEHTAAIMENAEQKAKTSNDIYGYLRVLLNHFDHDQQVELVEMLWDVICVDGKIHDHEANLVRRVTGMTAVSDRESGAAKLRAMERYGLS